MMAMSAVTPTLRDCKTLSEAVQVRGVTVRRRETDGTYGFTLVGSAPVSFKSVERNGPAHRAGVKQGDRIIQVRRRRRR